MRSGIVSPQFLAESLVRKDPRIKIFDSSLKVKTKRSPLEEFLTSRIRGAQFFDIENHFSDTSSRFPHTVPTLEQFKYHLNRLRVHPDDFIVAYDNEGIFASPRCWWLFKVMGWNEKKVAVLDGGLSNFQAHYPELVDSQPLTEDDVKTSDPEVAEVYPHLAFDTSLLRTIQQIEANLESQNEIVIDARSRGRFTGEAPEPRPHLSSGHMPFSISVPFDRILDAKTGCFKSPEEISDVFHKVGVDLEKENDKPLITSCGSGITASILYLGMYSSDSKRKCSLFDGSWSEYASTDVKTRPILKGD